MSMPTAFKNISPGASGPAVAIKAVTKSDTVDLIDGACRALLVGTAGSVNLIDADGNVSLNVPLQQGYNPLSVTRVKLGGTADNIWALY
jgi:hypothetical protein